MIEDIDYIVLLKDFYGKLLTAKQQQVLVLYYEEDLSLAEISEHTGSTRQAVHDLLRRAKALLYKYEARLGMVQQARVLKAELAHMEELLGTVSDESARTVLQQQLAVITAKI